MTRSLLPRFIATSVTALALTACFGKVTVVPSAHAPKPPVGEGWQCFESIAPVKYATPPRSKHTVHCKREADACTRTADTYRRDGKYEEVTTCTARQSAYCSATFTNDADASWACFGAVEDCEAQVGGMAGVPGTKQSQCSVYN